MSSKFSLLWLTIFTMCYLHKNIICKDGSDNNLVKTIFIGLKEKVLDNKSEIKNTEIQKQKLVDQLEDKKIVKTLNKNKDLNETVSGVHLPDSKNSNKKIDNYLILKVIVLLAPCILIVALTLVI